MLNAKKLEQLYSAMLGSRMVEERARVLVRDFRATREHFFAVGMEAMEVGALLALDSDDCVSCAGRELTVGFIRGLRLKDLYERLLRSGSGKPLTPGPGAGGLLPGAPTLAARMNIGAGVALAFKMQKKPHVVMAFAGNDATDLHSWRESAQFALTHKLPIVHIAQLDVGSGPVLQVSESEARLGSAQPGIPTFVVDGADVVAVCRVSQEAIRRARQGHGPALIECKRQRWSSHAKADAATLTLKADEPDPLGLMERYLQERRAWSEDWKAGLVKSFQRKLDVAVKSAERAAKVKAAG